MNKARTRLAPTPNGFLHLGHLFHIYTVKIIANMLGAEIILRLEDHDSLRSKREYKEQILKDLESLGLNFAEVYDQSSRKNVYYDFIKSLGDQVYPCRCSRKEIQQRIGKQAPLHYDQFCLKNPVDPAAQPVGLRLQVPAEDVIAVRDIPHPAVLLSPAREGGDILVRDRTGDFTYQLCVAVDDYDQGINWVIRGQDLQHSTASHAYLFQVRSKHCEKSESSRYLPQYIHHDLIYDCDATTKLSKSRFSEPLHVIRKSKTIGELEDVLFKNYENGLSGYQASLVEQLRGVF